MNFRPRAFKKKVINKINRIIMMECFLSKKLLRKVEMIKSVINKSVRF